MRNLVITALIFAISYSGKAQNTFSLKECMRYAVENNTSVKIQQYENLNTKQNKTEAVASLFPSLSASSSLTNSYGRSIDPETNAYTTSGYISNYYSISSSLTVFDGLSNINTVKASNIRVEMGGYQLEQQKDEKALSAMRLFYDVLYYEESVIITSEQLELSKKTLQLTEKQLELGIKSEADLALAVAQVANYDLLLTQQESNLAMARLNLKEAMNFPLNEEIALQNSEIMRIQNISEPTDFLENNPEIHIARNLLSVSKINLKTARGSYLPTISIGAGYSTNYYRMLDATTAQRAFSKQIKDNYGYYFGASISIPIFQGLSSRSNVIRSKNSLKIAELQLKETELKIEKAVRDAILQRESSLKEHIEAKKKIEANSLANKAMTKKYEQGIVSIIDLQKSSNDLLLAKAEELRARFNYKIQCVMVSYYNGEEIYN